MTNATRVLAGLTAALLLSIGSATAVATPAAPTSSQAAVSADVSAGECRLRFRIRAFSDTQWLVIGHIVRDGERYPNAKITLERSRGDGWDVITSAQSSDPEGKVVFVLSPTTPDYRRAYWQLTFAGDPVTAPCASGLFRA